MLSPSDRSLLHDQFRPPEGYRFDSAVGTTYSLDLVALMTVPLALTFFDAEVPEDEGREDDQLAPLALLEALRRQAARMTVFCHAGAIYVPRRQRPLFAFLEDAVFECLPSDPRGSFHPKVWLVRYTAPDEPLRYRLLCFSRNLTFDRSWDTALALDGIVADRVRGLSVNRPLREFVESLPGWSRRAVPPDREAQLVMIAEEIVKVHWELPPGFDPGIAFWPLGTRPRYGRPFVGRRDNFLVVSPFLEPGFAKAAGVEPTKREVVVSRPEALDALDPDEFGRYEDVYVLGDEGSREMVGADPDLEDDPAQNGGAKQPAEALRGLHAKVFVADAGWKARIWLGSANATPAAFTRNVEFLVELQATKSEIGLQTLLEPTPKTAQRGVSFADLLMPYQPKDIEPDLAAAAIENALDSAQAAVARSTAIATMTEDEGRTYAVDLRLDFDSRQPLEARLFCRPMTLGPAGGKWAEFGELSAVVSFRHVSFEALSAFFVFQVTIDAEDGEHHRQFVRRVELEGAPEGRLESVLRQVLRNRSDVMRYLLFLLSLEGADGGDGLSVAALSEKSVTAALDLSSEALLESLVRNLSRDPSRLDSVQRLVEDLGAEGRADLIPEGFMDVWGPIWSVRQRHEGATVR
ncbi:MAG: phospholipase D family protein [Thermoleophilia bacterium]